MVFLISPWSYSPFAIGLPANTVSTAATVGSWFGRGDGFGFASRYGYGYSTGSYISDSANWRFADRAYPQQQSGGYPLALEDRAKDYVRTALNKPWVSQFNRPATAYDAYNTNQHASITESERANNADGREKAVWDLADSLKDWMENGDKRADYSAALDSISKSSGGYSEKLAARVANLVVPGSTEVTEEVARTVLGHLKPAEAPAEKTPNSIMAAYIRKLGGESVAQSLVDEVSTQVASRGVPQKDRGDYVADLTKKGFKGPDAAAVYDKLLAGKTVSEKREALNKMGEVKTDKKDTTAEKEQYDQRARVAAMQAMGVKNDDELNALYGKYKSKNFSDFLEAMRKDVESGKIPKAAAASGGRGGRGRSPVPVPSSAPPPAAPGAPTNPSAPSSASGGAPSVPLPDGATPTGRTP